MIGEFEFYGIYFPAIFLPALLAFLVASGLWRLLDALGAYRYVWHRSLFNLALYVVVLGGMVTLTRGWQA